jgi:magnesium-transporting ATPase (P-type)
METLPREVCLDLRLLYNFIAPRFGAELPLLIIGLYMIDRVHQIWLGAAVGRAVEVEERLTYYRITRQISSKLKGWEALFIALLLYLGLLAVTAFIFLMALETSATFPLAGNKYQVYILCMSGISAIFVLVITFVTWLIGKS